MIMMTSEKTETSFRIGFQEKLPLTKDSLIIKKTMKKNIYITISISIVAILISIAAVIMSILIMKEIRKNSSQQNLNESISVLDSIDI